MQSEADAARAVALGAPAPRVSVSGNLKYDIGKKTEESRLRNMVRALDEMFALGRSPLIVAGSTSDGEEEMLVAAFEELRQREGLGKTRLLIAPRHPERFDAVARLLDSTRLRYVRRSAYAQQTEVAVAVATEEGAPGFNASISGPSPSEAQAADVILLDSIGELAALYAAASVVFVGGSLVPKGGHNILEPAFYSRPIVVGPHMENFREIAEEFRRREAVIMLRRAHDRELGEALRDALVVLLTDAEQARRLGERACRVVSENRGATARTVEAIARMIT
jgi:3-deoxy-D-manno-octulosonic-acid transferase